LSEGHRAGQDCGDIIAGANRTFDGIVHFRPVPAGYRFILKLRTRWDEVRTRAATTSSCRLAGWTGVTNSLTIVKIWLPGI